MDRRDTKRHLTNRPIGWVVAGEINVRNVMKSLVEVRIVYWGLVGTREKTVARGQFESDMTSLKHAALVSRVSINAWWKKNVL